MPKDRTRRTPPERRAAASRGERPAGRSAPARRAAPPPLPPATRASLALAALGVAACAVVTLTFRIADYDLWEHLAIGRAIATLHRVPATQLWTWPGYGTPSVNGEWAFDLLSWLVWQAGRLDALYAWDWLAAAVAFGFVWATARGLGARGHLPLLAIAVAVLTYRQRSVGRPETLAAIFLACELWLLERHRRQGGRAIFWLPALFCLWANAHLTYLLGLGVLAIHLVAGGRRGARERLLAAALAVVACFANPFGWQALAEPFRFALEQRREPIYRTIGELLPLDWRFNLRNGLPLLMLLWPLAQIARARRRRFDAIEALLCVTFTALTIAARRLVGMWVLVATPYLARDASEWLGRQAWPAWLRPPGARAAAVAVAALVVSIPEWLRPEVAIGMGVDPATTPAAACDFMQSHGIGGRAFNHFEYGSLMLFRFWPDRERLPFMDIHQAGTRESRAMYLLALGSAAGWEALDQRYGFDFALLRRLRARGDVLADVLDADSTWALVFTDDAAALYVRRAGRFAALADSCGYRWAAGGPAKLEQSWAAAMADSVTRRGFARELERMAAESPVNSTASSLLAYVADFEGRHEDARRDLARAHDVDPGLPRYHDRLGLALMSEGRLAAARKEFAAAARRHESPYPDFEIGLAWLREGNVAEARRALARSVATHPEIEAAADSLRALDARGR